MYDSIVRVIESTDSKHSDHLGGPGHASGGDFIPGGILLKTIDFERPSGREWLPSGTPFQNNTFFLEGFSDPRVYRYLMHLCSELFFLQRQKSVFKRS